MSGHAEVRNGQCYNKKTGRRIKACVPMHTFGHPMKIDELSAVCNEYHIELVEDAAESIGSFYKGRHTGTFGRVGAISFNGNKTITTGGGGMLLFQDEELGKFAKHLTTQAKVPHRWAFVHDHIGYNYRMPNINAALGCAQMENLDRYVSNKRETAEYTNDHGVMTRPVWELMNRLEMFRGCETDGLENTVWLEERIVNIPSSVRL